MAASYQLIEPPTTSWSQLREQQIGIRSYPVLSCRFPKVRERGICGTSDEKPHGKCLVPGTLLTMKFLIALAAVGIIAGIVYKVLTTEVPIDES